MWDNANWWKIFKRCRKFNMVELANIWGFIYNGILDFLMEDFDREPEHNFKA